MDKQSIIQYKTSFDAIASYIEGNSGKDKVEIWFARDLQPLLGYARWENFQVAINRAVESCKTQGVSIDDHFREVTKMVTLGSGATREVQDYMLTRYACYLIAQNGDPRKEQIAFAQSYFAVQTRKAELIEERLNHISRLETRERLRASEKQLSQNIFIYFAQSPCKHENENFRIPRMPSLLLWHCPSCPLKSYWLPILDSSGRPLSFHSR